MDEWDEGRALGFRIEVDPGSARALDEHVEIGGEHFDVLEGRYEIEERGGAVELHLTSRYRLSTPLRGYAALWADHIMRSIQESILEVIAARAEARSEATVATHGPTSGGGPAAVRPSASSRPASGAG